MEATIEELKDWLEELQESSFLIVVEGIKDKRSLHRLGITFVRSLNKPLYQVVEEIAAREKKVIILTDFDKKGKELYGKLKKDLINHGVKVDMHFREFLQQKTRVSHIEGLATYIKKRETRKQNESVK